MSIQCQHNLPRETCWMCNATTRLANAGITTPTNDDLIKELARQVADLREQLVAARAEREHFKNCISAREVRAMVDERNKAWSNLADARVLLKQANEMLAEAIVCGPKLRKRIIAALHKGEK